MRRDCGVTEKEKRMQKQEVERKRKENNKAKKEEQIVKRIEEAKKEWAKEFQGDKKEVE